MSASFVTRFAPSPTGRLHLGHAFSALTAFAAAQACDGRFLLRIEDIDPARCREEHAQALLEDLRWLGLRWEEPVRRQSEHFAAYGAALERLNQAGLLYRCFCTRKEIRAEIERAPSAPHGPEGPLYPGTCKRRSTAAADKAVARGRPYALRLDLAKAAAHLEERGLWPLHFTDARHGLIHARPEQLGDIVLARKDVPCSYHLAVVHDDAVQDVTDVIRGDDLLYATHIHRVLQALLGLPEPRYHHHRLITDAQGRRFAKRDRSATLAALRAEGVSPAEIRARLALPSAPSGA